MRKKIRTHIRYSKTYIQTPFCLLVKTNFFLAVDWKRRRVWVWFGRVVPFGTHIYDSFSL